MNKPQIRFKGFTDPWEQRKLGDIGFTYTGLSGKTKEDFGHGEASFVTYMNIFTNPISCSEDVEHVEIDNKQNEVRSGDVFFTTSSETPEEVGMSSVWLENKPNIYLNSFCFGYRPNIKINNYYLAYLLRSYAFRKDITLLAQGISRYNISKNKVMDIYVKLPSAKEQTLIGSYFKELDNLITLHQRKYDKLVNIKKSMLEKMFPKDGENVPEIRFKGFTDPWEQRKLDELISKGGSGGTPSTTNTDFYKGDIPFLSITDITNSNGYIYDTEKHITQEAMNSSAAWLVPSESISLAMYASVGKVAILKANCATSQAFYNMIFYQDETKNFVYQYLKNMEETNSWNSLISTGTQANLNAEKVKNLIISIPENKDEQKIISDYFNRLDDLITLHQRE